MPLEKLLTKPINARDFHPAEERPRSKAQQRFEELKRTPFYNDEGEYWNPSMFATQVETGIQFLGILAESMLGKKNIKGKYDELDRQLYDRERGLYRRCEYSKHMPIEQLLNRQLNARDIQPAEERSKINAEHRYVKLKGSSFYDENLNMWL
jgi:hypothetical protein